MRAMREGKRIYIKQFPKELIGLDYTLITNGAINGAIDRKGNGGNLNTMYASKICVWEGSCYPSLETMAKDIRTTPNNVSMLLNRLEKADYIKRVYKAFNGVEKLDIRLLV